MPGNLHVYVRPIDPCFESFIRRTCLTLFGRTLKHGIYKGLTMREYCITIVPDHIPSTVDWQPVLPVETPWGLAYRPGEEGKLLLPGNLHAYVGPIHQRFRSWLLQDMHNKIDNCIAIGGDGLVDFEDLVNSGETDIIYSHPLLKTTQRILNPQNIWAVILSRNCDDIDELRHQSVSELIDSIVDAYRYDKPQLGFISVNY